MNDAQKWTAYNFEFKSDANRLMKDKVYTKA
jgi:hypothetical protein